MFRKQFAGVFAALPVVSRLMPIAPSAAVPLQAPFVVATLAAPSLQAPFVVATLTALSLQAPFVVAALAALSLQPTANAAPAKAPASSAPAKAKAPAPSASASANAWEAVDRRVAPFVYQLNVAIEIRLANGLFGQLADMSPRKHYPVFITTTADQGFRVVGHGTCFPANPLISSDRSILLTNKHVVDFGGGMEQEAERFFAGMWLYAERSSMFGNVDQRYKELQRIVNYATKKTLSDTERTVYGATVDTIWDTYDDKLSIGADPARKEFARCVGRTGMKGSVGYFVHPPGRVGQPPLLAQLWKQSKMARRNDTDLAILTLKQQVNGLELDPVPAVAGQPIQAIGYPAAAMPMQLGQDRPLYRPSFSTGKITRVTPMQLHFDANVSKGDSGGPLISQSGRVLGIVTRRATAVAGGGDEQYAGAVSVLAIKSFAPELFGVPPLSRPR